MKRSALFLLMMLFPCICLSSDIEKRVLNLGASVSAGTVIGGSLLNYVLNRDQGAAKAAPYYYKAGVALYATAAVLSGTAIAINYLGGDQEYLACVEAFSPAAGFCAIQGANYCMSCAHDTKVKNGGFAEGRKSLLEEQRGPSWKDPLLRDEENQKK